MNYKVATTLYMSCVPKLHILKLEPCCNMGSSFPLIKVPCFSHSHLNEISYIHLIRSQRQRQKMAINSVSTSDNHRQEETMKVTKEDNDNDEMSMDMDMDMVKVIAENEKRKRPTALRNGGCGSIWGPAMAMIAVQVMFAASQILTKMAINEKMLVLAILTYRHVVAAVCIAPLAFFFDRGIDKKLTPNVCLWTFIAALTGITMGMGLFYYGLKDTSATYATNFSNLIPIVTFFFSIIVRMETLKLDTKWGRFKIVGAFLCVGGALVISLYKGMSLPLFHHNSHHKVATIIIKKTTQHWLRGTVLLVVSCIGYALWFIAQAQLLKVLPSKNWGNFLTCVVASIQTAILGICLDRNNNAWKLGWNVKLINVLFSGALASATSFYLIIWTVEKKGPVYPSMFDPLSVVFVAIIEAIFFGEDLTVGILLGMILMIVGLYSYLWGKRGESRNYPSTQVRRSNIDNHVVADADPEASKLF